MAFFGVDFHAMPWCLGSTPCHGAIRSFSTLTMKLNLRAQTAFAVCFLAGFTGCASVHTESGVQISQDKVAQIRKGVTTRAEVEALLGPPTNVSMMGAGKRMLTYHYTSTDASSHPTATTFIPYAGLFTNTAKAEAQTRTQLLQVMLNAQGVVDDFEFSDNTKNTEASTGGLLGANQTTNETVQPTSSK